LTVVHIGVSDGHHKNVPASLRPEYRLRERSADDSRVTRVYK
jgi:hypothetical protein